MLDILKKLKNLLIHPITACSKTMTVAITPIRTCTLALIGVIGIPIFNKIDRDVITVNRVTVNMRTICIITV